MGSINNTTQLHCVIYSDVKTRFPLPEFRARVHGPSWRPVNSGAFLTPVGPYVNSGGGNRPLRQFSRWRGLGLASFGIYSHISKGRYSQIDFDCFTNLWMSYSVPHQYFEIRYL